MRVIIALVPIIVIAVLVFFLARFLKGSASWRKADGSLATGQIAAAIIFWGLLSGSYLTILKVLPDDDSQKAAPYILRGQIQWLGSEEEVSPNFKGLFLVKDRVADTEGDRNTINWIYAPLEDQKPKMAQWALSFYYVRKEEKKDTRFDPRLGGMVEITNEFEERGRICIDHCKEMDEAANIEIELKRDPEGKLERDEVENRISYEIYLDGKRFDRSGSSVRNFLPDFASPAYAQTRIPFLAGSVNLSFQEIWKRRLKEPDFTLRQLNRRELISIANRNIPYEVREPLAELQDENKDVIKLIDEILSDEKQSYQMQMDALSILDGFKPALKEYIRRSEMLSANAIYTIFSLMSSSDPTAQESAFLILAECANERQAAEVLDVYIEFMDSRLQQGDLTNRELDEARMNYLRLLKAGAFTIRRAQRMDREEAIQSLENAVREAHELLPWAKERKTARFYIAKPLYELAAVSANYAGAPEEVKLAKERFQIFINFVRENGLAVNYSAAITRAGAYIENPNPDYKYAYSPSEYRVEVFSYGGLDKHQQRVLIALEKERFRQVEPCELANKSLMESKGIKSIPRGLTIQYPDLGYDMAKRIKVVLSTENPMFFDAELVRAKMEGQRQIRIFITYQMAMQRGL